MFMNVVSVESKSFRLAILVLVGILLLRLLTLGDIALVDSTEGRYGSIPLKMVLTGNWITPFIPMDTGWEPFWGKPPLSFWLSAVALKAFGFGEWAVRLPSVLSAALMVWFTIVVGRIVFDKTVGILAGLILASSGMVLYLSGAVVLDVTLAVAITGAFAAFIYHLREERASRRKIFGLLVFVAFGLGVLTKGPIAVIFPVGAIVLWSLITRTFHWIKTLPWFSGSALFFLITAPWLWAAEQATPGFL
jgi:4-amino-4-deoxy-L-arabinose transferase-like glycosyltransferase